MLFIILLGARRPSLDGIEANHEIIRLSLESKAVTMFRIANGVILSQMLRSGAEVFISKSTSGEELLKATRIVNNGDRYVRSRVTIRLAADLFGDDGGVEAFSTSFPAQSCRLDRWQKVSQISTYLELSSKTVYSGIATASSRS
jgi:DNA-binding NarL/FixJ family response regulator